ncbi:armadillo-type protein [Amylostereum chailletii]|nr:armadillo-type protein [Amylostereum chailletii]
MQDRHASETRTRSRSTDLPERNRAGESPYVKTGRGRPAYPGATLSVEYTRRSRSSDDDADRSYASGAGARRSHSADSRRHGRDGQHRVAPSTGADPSSFEPSSPLVWRPIARSQPFSALHDARSSPSPSPGASGRNSSDLPSHHALSSSSGAEKSRSRRRELRGQRAKASRIGHGPVHASSRKQTRRGPKGSPELYVQLLNDTISVGEAKDLLGILQRNKNWMQHFVRISGTPALGDALERFSDKRSPRRSEEHHTLEQTLLNCVDSIMRIPANISQIEVHEGIVDRIALSLSSPHIFTRTLVVKILLAFVEWEEGKATNIVLSALASLTANVSGGNSPYVYWFKTTRMMLSGGVEVCRAGEWNEVKNTYKDYALQSLLLVKAMLENTDDLRMRIQRRTSMDSHGLERIIILSRALNAQDGGLDQVLSLLKKQKASDEWDRQAREVGSSPSSVYYQIEQQTYSDILDDIFNIEDICVTLQEQTDDAQAQEHLLSVVQRLLLIPEENSALVFQLIKHLVADAFTEAEPDDEWEERRLDYVSPVGRLTRAARTERRISRAPAAHRSTSVPRQRVHRRPSKRFTGFIASLQKSLYDSRRHAGQLEKQLEKEAKRHEQEISAHKVQWDEQQAGYEDKVLKLKEEMDWLLRTLDDVENALSDALAKDTIDKDKLAAILYHLQQVWGEGSDDTTIVYPVPSSNRLAAGMLTSFSSGTIVNNALDNKADLLIEAEKIDKAETKLRALQMQRQLKSARGLVRNVIQKALLLHRGIHDRALVSPYGNHYI